MEVIFKKVVKNDCERLIEINNKAYYDDYVRYGECPGYNISIEKMKESLENKKIKKHLVYADNKPVGVVSVHELDNGEYYLGNLCVIPKYQHKGIGKLTVDFILNHYGDLKKLSLVTPADKVENVSFYTKKCGFKIVGTEMDGNVKVACFEFNR